ncbi:MAG: UvrD-helicase domain-containing protein, partial [Firmicutes bacterium]|nr:UvrD-helicase domain-containing protein [Bacillota bacterium]
SSGEFQDRLTDSRPLYELVAEKVEEYSGRIRSILELFEAGDTDRAVQALAEQAAASMPALSANKEEKPGYQRIADEVKTYRDDGKKSLKEAAALLAGVDKKTLKKENELLLAQLKSICRFTGEFSERYSKKKLSAGLMDFSDADHFALRILEDPVVRQELRDRFDCIFVDEYQDCNYVQEELVKRLSRGNNVFMVGDVKQSIYKFRLAEPGIFIQKYKDYSAGLVKDSAVIDLNMNFRSKAPVIDLVNKVFKDIMTERTVGMEYDSRSMLYGGPASGDGPLYDPELYLISRSLSEDSDADQEIADLSAVELEALNAAEVIKKYHKTPVPSEKGTVPLRYSDMAVLLRSAKNAADTYYKTFTDMGIPAFLAGGEGYFDTPEIQIFLNFLRITDNPAQDVPLISAMHFSGSGFSAKDLAEIRLASPAGRKSSYYDALRLFAEEPRNDGYEPLRLKAAAFLEKIRAWRKAAAALPLADFIWKMLSESGVSDFAMALPGGRQRMANLRAMADRAAAFEQESAEGIGGFAAYLELLAGKQSVGTGQAAVLSEADDVVRIMTIHKSKGMEFSFVLLAGMASDRDRGRDKSALRIHKDMGVSLKLKDPRTGITAVPLSRKLIELRKKRESLAEEIRILYVALTRAKDILVMSAAVPDAPAFARSAVSSSRRLKSFLNMVYGCIPKNNVIVRDKESFGAVKDDPRRAEIVRGIRFGFDVDESKLPMDMAAIRERLSFRCEPDPQELLKRKYSVSEITAMAAPKTHVRVKSGAAQDASDAVTKGNAYHKVMEHI